MMRLSKFLFCFFNLFQFVTKGSQIMETFCLEHFLNSFYSNIVKMDIFLRLVISWISTHDWLLTHSIHIICRSLLQSFIVFSQKEIVFTILKNDLIFVRVRRFEFLLANELCFIIFIKEHLFMIFRIKTVLRRLDNIVALIIAYIEYGIRFL